LMKRTEKRPLVRQSIGQLEAVIFAIVIGVSGVLLLGFQFNLTTALLGIIAILSYAFVYTPLKRIHSVAVLVGAFPGAMPPLIGWAAATGELSSGAFVLFAIQFIWQFPHFWSLAWVLDEDYTRAGFKMLPTQPGRSSVTAALVFFYAFLLIPIWFLPWQLGLIGGIPLVVNVAVSVLFCMQGWNLMRRLDNKAAVQMMLGSFLYLPLVQVMMMVYKLS
jgi:heme o synthase